MIANQNSRSFIVVLILATVGLIASTGWLDKRGYDYTQAGLQRALVTFGISRSLNGVISVAQGTEIAVEPVGIGMTFTPGQILDPVNDLIERFSTVVLVAGTAFGAQHVLLDVSASKLYAWLYWSLLAALVLSLLIQRAWAKPVQSWLMRASIMLAFIRFAVPLFAIGGEVFYQHFLQPQYEQSTTQLQRTSDQLNVLNEQTSASVSSQTENRSFLESAREWVESAGNALDWKEHMAEFAAAAESASEHAVKLMVVFVFQTLFMPLLAFWVSIKVCRRCMHLD